MLDPGSSRGLRGVPAGLVSPVSPGRSWNLLGGCWEVLLSPRRCCLLLGVSGCSWELLRALGALEVLGNALGAPDGSWLHLVSRVVPGVPGSYWCAPGFIWRLLGAIPMFRNGCHVDRCRMFNLL